MCAPRPTGHGLSAYSEGMRAPSRQLPSTGSSSFRSHDEMRIALDCTHYANCADLSKSNSAVSCTILRCSSVHRLDIRTQGRWEMEEGPGVEFIVSAREEEAQRDGVEVRRDHLSHHASSRDGPIACTCRWKHSLGCDGELTAKTLPAC